MPSSMWVCLAVAVAACSAEGPAPRPAAAPAPRVLVPAVYGDGDSDFAELVGLRPAIDAAVAAAADGRPERVVVYVESTADYGCLCPPFIFAPFYNGANPAGYPMVRVGEGAIDPVPHALISARLRLTGHFTGERIDGIAWLTERGLPLEEGMDEYRHPGPVFVVEAWCAEPDGQDVDFEAGAWQELARRQLICPGHAAPSRPD